MSDITLRKHGGNPASNAANERVEPTKRATTELVIDYVLRYPNGVTSEDVANHLHDLKPRLGGWPAHCVSPRISEAKEEFIRGTNIPRGSRRIMAYGLRGGRQVLVRYELQMRLLEVA